MRMRTPYFRGSVLWCLGIKQNHRTICRSEHVSLSPCCDTLRPPSSFTFLQAFQLPSYCDLQSTPLPIPSCQSSCAATLTQGCLTTLSRRAPSTLSTHCPLLVWFSQSPTKAVQHWASEVPRCIAESQVWVPVAGPHSSDSLHFHCHLILREAAPTPTRHLGST